MSQMSTAISVPRIHAPGGAFHVLRRTLIIGLTAFLTVVDLFATQAILPSLTGLVYPGIPTNRWAIST